MFQRVSNVFDIVLGPVVHLRQAVTQMMIVNPEVVVHVEVILILALIRLNRDLIARLILVDHDPDQAVGVVNDVRDHAVGQKAEANPKAIPRVPVVRDLFPYPGVKDRRVF